MGRLIIANLDCEIEYARALTPGPHPDLPRAVVQSVAYASTQLAVFARAGDRLWTLAGDTPPAAQVPEGVALVGTPIGGLAPARAVLPWAQTWSLGQLRTTDPTQQSIPVNHETWIDALWQLSCSPDIAARCNDRAFSAQLSHRLGASLPGAAEITSIGQLDEHLRAWASCGGRPSDAWVAKAPLAAAGREQLRRYSPELDTAARTRAERLLTRYGRLYFEPWVDRVTDVGVCGLVSDQSVLCFPPHRMECDRQGVIRAIVIADGKPAVDRREHQERIVEVAERTARALQEVGYRGPFSVDSFVYRRSGDLEIAPLSEINARISFGLVARAMSHQRGQSSLRMPLR